VVRRWGERGGLAGGGRGGPYEHFRPAPSAFSLCNACRCPHGPPKGLYMRSSGLEKKRNTIDDLVLFFWKA
jgi:hypothetical protein